MLELSFTQFKNYRACPRRYQAERTKARPPLTPQEKYNASFGSIMGEVAERFYKSSLFMDCTNASGLIEVYNKLKAQVAVLYNKYLGGVEVGVKGRPLTKEQMIERCEKATKTFLSTVIKNRLYGDYTNAEIVLRLSITDYKIALNGRPDLAIASKRKDETRVIILDFKSRPSKSVVRDQLAWYALLWYYKFSLVPTEVGFFYFELTKDSPDHLQVFSFAESDLSRMMAEILATRDRILADKNFKPTPNDQCWNCGIRQDCPASKYYKNKQDLEVLNSDSPILSWGDSADGDVPPPPPSDGGDSLSLDGIFD